MSRILVVMLAVAIVLLVITAVPGEVITSNMQGRLGIGGGASLESVAGDTILIISPVVIYGLNPKLYLVGELTIANYAGYSSFSIEVNPCYNFTPQNQTGLYAGGTIGIISADGTSSLYLGPVGGVQYFLTRNLAVDGQLRLVFYTGLDAGTSFGALVRVNCYLR